jgi:hypothetical protein
VTPDEIWRGKSDEDLLAASRRLSEYSEVGQRVIIAELNRRRDLGLVSEAVFESQSPEVDDSSGPSERTVGFPFGYAGLLIHGHIPLPITYWLWGVGGNFAWVIVFGLAAAMNMQTLVLLLASLNLAYFVFICVAIWRSSGKYKGKRIWAELARISLAAGIAKAGVNIFFGS